MLLIRCVFCFCCLLLLSYPLIAQPVFFKTIQESKVLKSNRQRTIKPLRYRPLRCDTGSLRAFLKTVPKEQSTAGTDTLTVIGLPLPDGTTGYFHIWESSILAPGLAARFPNLKTYTGQGLTNAVTAKLDWTEAGFHAMLTYPTGQVVFIDPYALGLLTIYQSYYRSDLRPPAKPRQPDKVSKP